MIATTDTERIAAYINSVKWVFAKTMPENPHEYIVRGKQLSDDDFVSFVNYIRANGYVKPFQGRNYTGIDIEGYYYWTMGSPMDMTKIINRKCLK